MHYVLYVVDFGDGRKDRLFETFRSVEDVLDFTEDLEEHPLISEIYISLAGREYLGFPPTIEDLEELTDELPSNRNIVLYTAKKYHMKHTTWKEFNSIIELNTFAGNILSLNENLFGELTNFIGFGIIVNEKYIVPLKKFNHMIESNELLFNSLAEGDLRLQFIEKYVEERLHDRQDGAAVLGVDKVKEELKSIVRGTMSEIEYKYGD